LDIQVMLDVLTSGCFFGGIACLAIGFIKKQRHNKQAKI